MALARKDLTEDMIRKVGLRMKACRVLTGLNQEQFAEKFEISYTTIRNWEYGQVIPRRQGILEFIKSLNSCGVFVEADWLLAGFGRGPYFNFTRKNEIIESSANLDDIEIFSSGCIKRGENPVISRVADNSMSPLFCYGDVVGGVLIDTIGQDNFVRNYLRERNLPLLVRLEDGNYAPRKVMFLGNRIIVGTNNFDVIQSNNPSLAIIRLHIIN